MHCSVVFGVTLRLLVINISSSSPAINTAAYYQRCVTTCGTVAAVHRRPCWQHLACCSVNSRRRYRLRIAISAFPTCIRRPLGWGVPVGVLLCRLVWKKLEWCGYPTVKKILMICLFVLTESKNVPDTQWQTDGQTDTAWRHRPHLHSIARQKLAAVL